MTARVPWTRSQVVAIVTGTAAALLLLLVGAGMITYLAVEQKAQASLTPTHFDLGTRVQIEDHPQLRFGRGPFTISLWFKTSSQQKYMTLISKRVSTMGDGWVLGANDQNAFSFYTAGCSSPATSPQQFRDGQWHHLAAVREGQTLTIFFDNQTVGSGPDPCNHNDSNPIRIGMDADKGWQFEGEIAEVHLYGRALNSLEIAEEWNNRRARKGPVSAGGLLAGFHLGESTGIANDFTGNGHRGILIHSTPEPTPN